MAQAVPGPASPVIFLHIPRTAGFSLKQMVEWCVGAQRSLLDVHILDGEDVRRHVSEFSFIEGHAPANWFRRVVGDAWPRCGVTILREPVARAVSQVRHLRAGSMPFRSAPWYWDGLNDRVKDPEEVFERIPRLSNLQTKMLATRGFDALSLDESALTDAKAVVDAITFGLTETFVTSLALIGEHFEMAFPRITKVNASPAQGDDDLRSAAFMEAAAAHNDLDLRLYEYAASLLEERLASHCAELLALDLDDAKLDGAMGVLGKPLDAGMVVASEDRELQVRGWVMLAGEVADAVLVRVDDRVTPLVCRVLNIRAANQTRRVVARFAGVRGSVAIPADAASLEVIAFDRARGLRGSATFPLTRPVGRGTRKSMNR